MNGELAVVLVLLVAAFVAGWVARDPPGRDPAPPPPPEPEPRAGGEDGPGDGGAAVREAAHAVEAAVDAWLDGDDPEQPLARVRDARARLQAVAGGPSAAVDDARAALDEAVALLEPFRAGRPMDAATSRSLEPLEGRLLQAARALA